MRTAVQPTYSPDNPFAPKGAAPQGYSPDNPFAPKAAAPAQTYSADNPFAPKPVPMSVTETTPLNSGEESKFQRWTQANKITDVDHPDSHYDYRGFWKETGGTPIKFGVDHFPDTYKQHGHPTFSVESKYSSGVGDGGRWEGNKFVPPTLTDSLVSLTGGKKPGGGVSPDAANVGGGEYDPKNDELWTAPNAKRDVVTHEYGHRYDEGPGAPPAGRLRRLLSPAAANRPRPTDRAQSETDSTAIQSENAADAFARAVAFLQSPDSRGAKADSTLGAAEAKQPGTQAVVQELLKQPIYANHPLRQSTDAMRQPDEFDMAAAKPPVPITEPAFQSSPVQWAPPKIWQPGAATEQATSDLLKPQPVAWAPPNLGSETPSSPGAQGAADEYQKHFGQKPQTVATAPAEGPEALRLRTPHGDLRIAKVGVRGDSTDIHILDPHKPFVGEKDGVMTVPSNTIQEPMREAHVTVGRPLSGIEQEAPYMSQPELERAANDPNLKTKIATRLAMTRLPSGTTTKAPDLTWSDLAAHVALNAAIAPFDFVGMGEASNEDKFRQVGLQGEKLTPSQINLLAGISAASALVSFDRFGKALGAGSGMNVGPEASVLSGEGVPAAGKAARQLGARIGTRDLTGVEAGKAVEAAGAPPAAKFTGALRAGAAKAIADVAAEHQISVSRVQGMITKAQDAVAARGPQLIEAAKAGAAQGTGGAVGTGAVDVIEGKRDPAEIMKDMGMAFMQFGALGGGLHALSSEAQFTAGYNTVRAGLEGSPLARRGLQTAVSRGAGTGQPGPEFEASQGGTAVTTTRPPGEPVVTVPSPDHLPTWNEATQGPKPTLNEHEAHKADAIETLTQHTAAVDKVRQVLDDVFGPKDAKRYATLQTRANTSIGDAQTQATREISDMESKLTPDQRSQLQAAHDAVALPHAAALQAEIDKALPQTEAKPAPSSRHSEALRSEAVQSEIDKAMAPTADETPAPSEVPTTPKLVVPQGEQPAADLGTHEIQTIANVHDLHDLANGLAERQQMAPETAQRTIIARMRELQPTLGVKGARKAVETEFAAPKPDEKAPIAQEDAKAAQAIPPEIAQQHEGLAIEHDGAYADWLAARDGGTPAEIKAAQAKLIVSGVERAKSDAVVAKAQERSGVPIRDANGALRRSFKNVSDDDLLAEQNRAQQRQDQDNAALSAWEDHPAFMEHGETRSGASNTGSMKEDAKGVLTEAGVSHDQPRAHAFMKVNVENRQKGLDKLNAEVKSRGITDQQIYERSMAAGQRAEQALAEHEAQAEREGMQVGEKSAPQYGATGERAARVQVERLKSLDTRITDPAVKQEIQAQIRKIVPVTSKTGSEITKGYAKPAQAVSGGELHPELEKIAQEHVSNLGTGKQTQTADRIGKLPADQKSAVTDRVQSILKGVREDADRSYGSPEKKDAAARQVAPLLDKISGLPTVLGRAAQVAAAEKRGWTPLVGALAKTPEQLRAVLTLARHPAIEHMGIGVRDAAGTIIGHRLYTSGVIDQVHLTHEQIADFADWVAQQVYQGNGHDALLHHNHPSGDPTLSDLDEKFTKRVERELNDRGVALAGHMVIDHDTAVWFHRDEDGDWTHDPVHVPGADKDAEWATAHERPRTTSDSILGQILPAVRPDGITTAYLDTKHKIVAVEPRPVSDLDATPTWLMEQRKVLGARAVVIAVPADQHARVMEAVTQHRGHGALWAHYIEDVVGVGEGRDGAPTLVSGVATKQFQGPDEDATSRLEDVYGATRIAESGKETPPRNGTLFVRSEPAIRRAGDASGGVDAGSVRPSGVRQIQRGGVGNEPSVRDDTEGTSATAGEGTGPRQLRRPGSQVGERDLFGNEEPEKPSQSQHALFSPQAGTEASRSLKETERAAQAELAKLRPQLAGNALNKPKIAARIAELEKLVNRDKAISADELKTRAASESVGEKPAKYDAKATENSMGRPITTDKKALAAFRKWFGKSQVVDDAGRPLVLLHGTTADFDSFDASRGNIESDWGAATGYFTNTPEDAESNYAGMGPDLTQKIELRAEQIMGESKAPEAKYGSPKYIRQFAAAKAKAAKELGVQHQGATVPVYLKMEKPFVLGGKGETKLTYDSNYDAESDEYGEPTGTLVDFIDALRNVASRYDDGSVDELVSELHQLGSDYESVPASKVIEAIKADKQFGYHTDENGNLASNDIVRQAVQRAGFDGVIDNTVNTKFGSARRIGKQMAGMDEDTVHYIAFEPTQIKSAIGNAGTFNPHDENITREKPPAYKATGIKNAASAAERENLGMGPRKAVEPRTQKEMYDAGKAIAEANPKAVDDLMTQLRSDPEKIVGTEQDAGLLLKSRVDLDNELHRLSDEYDRAEQSGDEAQMILRQNQLDMQRERIRDFIHLYEQTGTATGRALAARKMMSKLDYSLSQMEYTVKSAAGDKPVSPEDLSSLKELSAGITKDLAESQANEKAAKERAAEAESKLHYAELKLEAQRPIFERIQSKLDADAEKAMSRIRARGLRAMSGIDPELLKDYAIVGAAQLTKGVTAFTEWADRIGVKAHADEIRAAAEKNLDKAAGAHKAVAKPKDTFEKIQARLDDGASLRDLKPYLRQLALEHIKAGVTEREPLLTALHDDLVGAGIVASKSEVRDALSGYGDFTPLNKEADVTRLREIQGEARKLAQLEALQRGKAPLASGREFPEPSDEERRLTKQVNDAKKKMGIGEESPEGRLKSALASAKTRVRNQIKDLQTEIDTGTRIVKGKSTLIADTELTTLKKQLADLRKTEAEVFTKPELTDEQRLDLATKAAKRSADLWDERLNQARKGEFAPKGPVRILKPSAELDALKAHVQAARAEYQELKGLDPAQQQLASVAQNKAYRTRLAQREAELQDRIAREDYSPKPPRPSQKMDEESRRIQARVKDKQDQYWSMVRKYRQQNRPPEVKAAHFMAAWARFGVLSSVNVFEKLTGAAAARYITTPAEQLIGYGVSKVFPKLAAQAPREGVPTWAGMVRAEAAAQTRFWTEGIKGSGQILLNRRTTLQQMHDPHGANPEWHQYLGQLHMAFKNPIFEAEYARSYQARTEHAIVSGEDTTDPYTHLRLSNEAYLDAKRAVFLNENIATGALKTGLRWLEKERTIKFPTAEAERKARVAWEKHYPQKSDESDAAYRSRWEASKSRVNSLGLAAGALIRTAQPIVSVPTNFAYETAESLLGLPVGLTRAILRSHGWKGGEETLHPDEADAIMRQMKKGTIGGVLAALAVLGFFAAGGLYRRGEKRAPDDLAPGDIGPLKHVWLHNPQAAVINMGVTARRVAQSPISATNPEPKGWSAGDLAALVGLLDLTPYLGTASAIASVRDAQTQGSAVQRGVAGTIVPTGLQQWAKSQDDSGTVRKPEGWLENLEADLPYLRQNVPTADDVKAERKAATHAIRSSNPRSHGPRPFQPRHR